MNLEFPSKKIVPIVDAYLSLILTYKNIYGSALAENFIRCFYDEDNWIDYYKAYDFNQYGVFKGFELTSDFLKLNKLDISTIIENSLKSEYFILYVVDSYYIHNYVSYKKKHKVHPLLILEENNLNKSYKCRDYFDSAFYTEQLVSIDEIKNSFFKCYIEEDNYHNNLILGFKLEQNNINSLESDKIKNNNEINLSKIIYLLEEYIKGENFFIKDINYYDKKEETEFSTGINIINSIKHNMIEILEEKQSIAINIKMFKFLEHHIYIMKKRIEILNIKYNIDIEKQMYNHITEILKNAEILSYIIIKFNIKKHKDILLKAINILDFIKNEYLAIIIQLIEVLEKKQNNIRKN